MGRLFACEIKKLLSRKLIIPVLLLFFTLTVFMNRSGIDEAISGYSSGKRDIYRHYAGQTVTTALQKQARSEYADFALSHADRFNTVYDEGQNSISYWAKDGFPYEQGIADAYSDIYSADTVEMLSRNLETAKAALQLGKDRNGKPLSPSLRQEYEEKVKNGFDTPVVQNLQGWESIGRAMGSGYFMLFLLALGLLPVFTSESSAKMDGVLLCSKARGQALAAKMAAAGVYTLGVFALIFGFEFLLIALLYGLNGASLPVSALNDWWRHENQTIAGLYVSFYNAAAAASLANAALAVLASSLSRHALSSLLITAGVVAVQFLPATVLLVVFSEGTTALSYLSLLPTPALASPWDWLNGIKDATHLLFAMGLPALLVLLTCVVAPRCYLKRSRA